MREHLSPSEVDHLESRARAGTADFGDRTRLVVHHIYRARRHAGAELSAERHALWMVEHCPTTVPTPIVNVYMARHRAVADAWRKQVERHPQNPAVLVTASEYFLWADRPTAHALLDRAEAAAPRNAVIFLKHSRLYRLEDRNGSKPAVAAKALTKLEQGVALSPEPSRFDHKADLARYALFAGDPDKAKAHASDILAEINARPRTWNTGNLVHGAHLVLGLLALRAGDIVTAKQHLLDSARIGGSPQLNSFGPNMLLAEELLKKGERQVVLDYLDLCAHFWEMGKPKLEIWRDQITRGDAPDFGANLDY
jgi:hypothetical protein